MKTSICKVAIIAAITVLAGCAAKPVVKGDSEPQQKNATFPKIGQQIHVVNGGLVHLRTDYMSRYAYKLTSPWSIGFMLGQINVFPEDILLEANLDGQDVFCTARNVFNIILGPSRNACFIPLEKGKLKTVKVRPGEVWFSKEIDPPIAYIGLEVPISSSGKPFKRELVFEGTQNGNIFFTEKFYEMSLESPSKVKPVMSKIEMAPSQITLNGAVLNVVAFTANSLTFTLEKPWE